MHNLGRRGELFTGAKDKSSCSHILMSYTHIIQSLYKAIFRENSKRELAIRRGGNTNTHERGGGKKKVVGFRLA